MKGVIVYYFGDDKNSTRTITKILSIKVSEDKDDIKNIPGFGIAPMTILLLIRLIVKIKL